MKNNLSQLALYKEIIRLPSGRKRWKLEKYFHRSYTGCNYGYPTGTLLNNRPIIVMFIDDCGKPIVKFLTDWIKAISGDNTRDQQVDENPVTVPFLKPIELNMDFTPIGETNV